MLGPGRAISLRPLPAGHHTLLLEYPGDLHYKPVKTIVPLDVFGSSMEGMTVARGTAAAVTVVWNAPYSGAVARKRVNESWSTMPGGTYYPTADSDALPETVYLYRLESGDGKVSAADIGMRIAFTDEPLIPGMAIRAQHLKEVVRAANILRAAASLPALSSTLFTAGAPITAQQITALRRGINEARVAVGAYPFMFAGNVVSGAPIRAAHIEELREAIR
jgi:hypothetical protein